MRRWSQDGAEWGVDLDLENFFDRINHDILMPRVARRVKDPQVLNFIWGYLQAGVMLHGVSTPRTRIPAARSAPPSGGTDRHAPGSPSERIQQVNRFLAGWVGYFVLADRPTSFPDLDSWIRHRFRAIVWRRWKRVRTRLRGLRALQVPDRKAWKLADARKGPWCIAAGPLNSVVTIAYWDAQGLNRL